MRAAAGLFSAAAPGFHARAICTVAGTSQTFLHSSYSSRLGYCAGSAGRELRHKPHLRGSPSLKRSPQAAAAPRRWSPSGCWLSPNDGVGCGWEMRPVPLTVPASSCGPSPRLNGSETSNSHPGTSPSGSCAAPASCACCKGCCLGAGQLLGPGTKTLQGSCGGLRVDTAGCLCCVSACASLGNAQGLPGCLLCCEKSGLLL